MIRTVKYGRLLALSLAVLLAYTGLLGWLFYRQIGRAHV